VEGNGTAVQGDTDRQWRCGFDVHQLQPAKESQVGEEIGLHSRMGVFFELGKKRFRLCFDHMKIAENKNSILTTMGLAHSMSQPVRYELRNLLLSFINKSLG